MQHAWIGGGLRFSYCTEHDLPAISRMLAKESVCRWLFFGPNTDEATRSYFLPLIEEMRTAFRAGRMPDHHVFTVRLEDTGDFVGQCALFPIDFSPGSFLIGYQLDDACWKRGYGTRACTFLVYFAFTVLDGYRLNGDTVAGNTTSQRVMESCGFVLEGIQRQYWHAGGEYHDRLIFGLLKTDLAPERLSGLGEMFTTEHSAEV
ncbi:MULTISPECIES: GNAT family N-acetyltransferase [Methanoculleus]|uniref:GCN5-related N-acetyltransferase n=2 Tax=Methanoculleus TaxID=45989 RepID=A3CV36_METMJ|nr:MULTISPECIES: GNAT family protein [Methanoculleus]ABN57236.1 GCN5-related N-acetyltransferase [Methanoculleus marisnigri JR1]UYU18651.1 GNAT family N-acetyltransferase [Methanoculleus submarinus]